MRSMWNGTLHLAELAIPVGLAAGKGKGDIALTTLHRVCRNQLEQTMQCPIHGEVPADELVKGWEVTPGEYVIVEDDELEAAKQISDDHRIEVTAIVAAAEVSPTLVLKTFFVKPAGKSPAALKPYRLLAAALAELDAAAIVTFTAWSSEHVAAIRPLDERVLIAQTLVVDDDIRTPDAIAETMQAVDLEQPELELAHELLDRMLVPFDTAMLANGRRQRVRDLLEAKLTGNGTVRPDPVSEEARQTGRNEPTLDLADALRRSLKATKKPRRRRATATA